MRKELYNCDLCGSDIEGKPNSMMTLANWETGIQAHYDLCDDCFSAIMGLKGGIETLAQATKAAEMGVAKESVSP
jgi:ribosome-binding protein aMBF1 (putative translation factor)